MESALIIIASILAITVLAVLLVLAIRSAWRDCCGLGGGENAQAARKDRETNRQIEKWRAGR